jgi:hypothetical protein
MPRPALDPALLEKLRITRQNIDFTDVLAIGDPALDAFLPHGGLPPGVTELRAPHGLGGGTELALFAVRAALRVSPEAWCAWMDPEGTLYAPRAVQLGIELSRLLIVRPPRRRLEHVATRVLGAGAFELVVIDADPPSLHNRTIESTLSEVVIRRLALASEKHGTRVLLLSNAHARRPLPWPVAMRLELEQKSSSLLSVRIAKERHGELRETVLSLAR